MRGLFFLFACLVVHWASIPSWPQSTAPTVTPTSQPEGQFELDSAGECGIYALAAFRTEATSLSCAFVDLNVSTAAVAVPSRAPLWFVVDA